MIVRCIAASGRALPPSALNSRMGIRAETEFAITPGKEYHVYALTVLLGLVWYYVIDDDDPAWPVWKPAPLFEVADGWLPSTWQFGYFRFDLEQQYPVLSFPEWAHDYYFYERLVDGDPTTVAIFERRRLEIERVARL